MTAPHALLARAHAAAVGGGGAIGSRESTCDTRSDSIEYGYAVGAQRV